MPALGRPTHSFIALWVEDDTARIWNVEVASGAMDEIARFNISGMKRPNVLELARQFVRARGPISRLEESEQLEPGERKPQIKPASAKRARRRKLAGQYGTLGPHTGYKDNRANQIARQEELYEALKRHGGDGVIGHALAVELGRKTNGIGVSLGILERQGKALRVDGKWYAVENGNIPAPPK